MVLNKGVFFFSEVLEEVEEGWSSGVFGEGEIISRINDSNFIFGV